MISKQWDIKFEIDLKKEVEKAFNRKIDILIDQDA